MRIKFHPFYLVVVLFIILILSGKSHSQTIDSVQVLQNNVIKCRNVIENLQSSSAPTIKRQVYIASMNLSTARYKLYRYMANHNPEAAIMASTVAEQYRQKAVAYATQIEQLDNEENE